MKRRDFLRYGAVGLGGLTLEASSLSWLVGKAQAAGAPWKFGVMSDTQWRSGANSGGNPGTCAVGIINALNQEFIRHGCKFVIQCGDLVDTYSNANMDVRKNACQALYDAGIGFFPVRGNHDDGASAGVYFADSCFPQTQGTGNNLHGVSNVIASSISGLRGLSYAFDFENVRVVLIDQFKRRDNTGSTNTNLLDQVTWVDSVLTNRSSDMHAFVVAHKNLAGQNHKDCIFGGSQTDNIPTRNQFTSVLQANKVGYYMGGHDHQHYRCLYTSPDGTASAEQIITASNSYKFYIPTSPYDNEKPLAHELFTIGYYIFTVDGPCVTVEFYSSSHGADYGDIDLIYTPGTTSTADYAHGTFYFDLRERFGYSLNGKSFTIARGGAYTPVQDMHAASGTTAKILAGSNGNAETDFGGHQMVKTVKTGWRDMPSDAASAVLKLWGLADNLSLYDASLTGLLPGGDEPQTSDTYTLSISFDSSRMSLRQLRAGEFGIKAQQSDGSWVNAVDMNTGGAKKFVYGAYNSHALGSYGVNPATMTAWAVINHDGAFVVK